MKHVFISYVNEDSGIVQVIKTLFGVAGDINVWIDRNNLEPGQRWKDTIRRAIKEAEFFIACFSKNYYTKESSFMNDELTIAIEQLRLKHHDKPWLIPIRLSDCKIPDRPIGAGETLMDLHYVDLSKDFRSGINALFRLMIPQMSPHIFAKQILKMNLEHHIFNKIEYFKKTGVATFKEINDRWRGLLEIKLLDLLSSSFSEIRERSKATGKTQTDVIFEQGENGRYIIISATPVVDIKSFLSAIKNITKGEENPYIDFIVKQRNRFCNLSNWDKRDLVHIIYFEEGEDTLFDVLYIINFNLFLAVTLHLREELKSKGGKIISFANMYPTSIISSIEANKMFELVRDIDFSKK